MEEEEMVRDRGEGGGDGEEWRRRRWLGMEEEKLRGQGGGGGEGEEWRRRW